MLSFSQFVGRRSVWATDDRLRRKQRDPSRF